MAAEHHNGEAVSTQGECSDCSTTIRRERSFDELAKSLANGSVSRRKALRLMGSALVGSVLASIPGVAWAAKPSCPSGVRCKGQCCGPGEVCKKGSGGGCVPCPAGTTACSGQCVDTLTDANNCGGCGNVCHGPDPNGGTALPPECINGYCGSRCTAPGTQCIQQCPTYPNCPGSAPVNFCGATTEGELFCTCEERCAGQTSGIATGCTTTADCPEGQYCFVKGQPGVNSTCDPESPGTCQRLCLS
jgi:hypothetical protein